MAEQQHPFVEEVVRNQKRGTKEMTDTEHELSRDMLNGDDQDFTLVELCPVYRKFLSMDIVAYKAQVRWQSNFNPHATVGPQRRSPMEAMHLN
jgi:hypothetical protein